MQEEVFSLEEPSEEVSLDPTSHFLIMDNDSFNGQTSQCQTPRTKHER